MASVKDAGAKGRKNDGSGHCGRRYLRNDLPLVDQQHGDTLYIDLRETVPGWWSGLEAVVYSLRLQKQGRGDREDSAQCRHTMPQMPCEVAPQVLARVESVCSEEKDWQARTHCHVETV